MKYILSLMAILTCLLYISVPSVSAGQSPQVTSQNLQPRVKELPRTGLESIAFVLIGLIPLGLKLKNIGKIGD